MKSKGSGWKGESRRHSLARKGIRTSTMRSQGLGKVTSDQKVVVKSDAIYINGKKVYFEYIDMGHERLFLSIKEYNHPDGFDYKMVISVIDLYEATGEEDDKGKYITTLQLVPKMKGENREELIESIGIKKPSEDTIYIDAQQYGYGLNMRSEEVEESEVNEYLKELAIEGELLPSLSGFYLDRPVNRLGETGWDWLQDWGVMER